MEGSRSDTRWSGNSLKQFVNAAFAGITTPFAFNDAVYIARLRNSIVEECILADQKGIIEGTGKVSLDIL